LKFLCSLCQICNFDSAKNTLNTATLFSKRKDTHSVRRDTLSLAAAPPSLPALLSLEVPCQSLIAPLHYSAQRALPLVLGKYLGSSARQAGHRCTCGMPRHPPRRCILSLARWGRASRLRALPSLLLRVDQGHRKLRIFQVLATKEAFGGADATVKVPDCFKVREPLFVIGRGGFENGEVIQSLVDVCELGLAIGESGGE